MPSTIASMAMTISSPRSIAFASTAASTIRLTQSHSFVDGESIMFCMRALMLLYRSTGEDRCLSGARRAADLVVTWINPWDVPEGVGLTE
jgi:hypothetical protein